MAYFEKIMMILYSFKKIFITNLIINKFVDYHVCTTRCKKLL